MKRLLPVAVCVLLGGLAFGQNQLQVRGSVCTIGSARITFLTPELVRLEWSAGRQFADWPSAVVVKRNWPAVPITAEQLPDGAVILRTAKLALRYQPPDRFSATDLAISSPLIDGVWHPGEADPGNLRGTTGSLDGMTASHLRTPGLGLLSRSGWFFYDDSGHPLLSPKTHWLVARDDPKAADWYFCAYGLDYARALLLGSDLFGHVYMPPKWAFGAWYSRYYPYTAAQERAIVSRFRSSGIPLDVLVIDVDWHPNGWESYDWNRKLFPDPAAFLAWVHKQGCKVTLNNHPGQIPKADSHFDALCKRLGINPAGRDSINLNMANQAQCAASFDILRKPLMKEGINFWWIDGSSAGMPGLNSQQWTSKEYFDYTQKFTGHRGMVLARWGGLGDRYPVGFSGDTFSQWGVLGYEVADVARAGNVLFPYWSNDIGGFHGDRDPTDLYVRWVEFGALSPILRLHSDHGIREPWNYGAAGVAVARRYFRLRYALLPYIYSAARRTYDTGEPLCKPLYLDWPKVEEAYHHDHEYLFGDSILVAPISAPAPAGQPARRPIWLPPGNWVDFWTGDAYPSGTIDYAAGLQRLPMFLRRGSIVVERPVESYVGQKPDNDLRALVTVGKPKASFRLYEDDGESQGYEGSAYATTELTLAPGAGTHGSTDQTLTIGAASGSFAGQVKSRRWTVEVRGRFAPKTVVVDGKTLRRAADGPDDAASAPRPSWRYDPATLRTYVYLPTRPPSQATTVALRGGSGWRDYAAYGEAQRLATLLREAPKRVAGLPGKWAELDRVSAEAAGRAEALAKSLAGGKTSAQAAAPAFARLTDRDLPAVADAAARGAADASSRFQALAAVLGVGVRGHLAISPDGKTARLTPVLTCAASGPGRRVVDSLRGPGGRPAAESAASATFSRYFPAGRFTLSLPLTGAWDGLPVATTVTASTDASALQLFHLVGPFDNTNRKGITTAYPPEKSFRVGAKWQGKAGPVTWRTTSWRWQPATTSGGVLINLVPLFTPHDNTVAYAAAYVWSPKDSHALALMGTDDEGALWVNGAHVFTYPNPRPAAPGQDRIPIKLRRGWNTLLVKICQEGGNWGFFLQLADAQGKPLTGLWTALRPEGTPPGS